MSKTKKSPKDGNASRIVYDDETNNWLVDGEVLPRRSPMGIIRHKPCAPPNPAAALPGRTIKRARKLAPKELHEEGSWSQFEGIAVLELDDGSSSSP